MTLELEHFGSGTGTIFIEKLGQKQDNDDYHDGGCGCAQAALPEPVVPPAAGRVEAVAAVLAQESLSSASWCQLWAGDPPPHQSPGAHIWRNVPPEREKERGRARGRSGDTAEKLLKLMQGHAAHG